MPQPDEIQQINDLMFRTSKCNSQTPFREFPDQWRATIDLVSKGVRNLMSHPALSGEAKQGEDHGEAKANIMLAYRHLEDARMRLGKAIQAMEGGVSIYDKPLSGVGGMKAGGGA